MASTVVYWLKTSTDASYNAISGATKLGGVIWVSYGKVLLSALFGLERTESVLHAEIRAIHMGLQIACKKG